MDKAKRNSSLDLLGDKNFDNFYYFFKRRNYS